MVFQKVLWPALVPEQTMEHIHRYHEGHITRNEILDVLNREPKNLIISPASSGVKSDYTVRGKTLDGKQLLICVILNNRRIDELYKNWNLQEQVAKPASYYASLVYNGWCI